MTSHIYNKNFFFPSRFKVPVGGKNQPLRLPLRLKFFVITGPGAQPIPGPFPTRSPGPSPRWAPSPLLCGGQHLRPGCLRRVPHCVSRCVIVTVGSVERPISRLPQRLSPSPLRKGDLSLSGAQHIWGHRDWAPVLSTRLSCDLAKSPQPGVVIYQSEAIPGDLAGLSQRKTTQND